MTSSAPSSSGTDYVVTEDVGLNLRCLNGFPGPYCKPMLESIGDNGLWELMKNYDDKHALVTCTLAAVNVAEGSGGGEGEGGEGGGGGEGRDANSSRACVGVEMSRSPGQAGSPTNPGEPAAVRSTSGAREAADGSGAELLLLEIKTRLEEHSASVEARLEEQDDKITRLLQLQEFHQKEIQDVKIRVHSPSDRRGGERDLLTSRSSFATDVVAIGRQGPLSGRSVAGQNAVPISPHALTAQGQVSGRPLDSALLLSTQPPAHPATPIPPGRTGEHDAGANTPPHANSMLAHANWMLTPRGGMLKAQEPTPRHSQPSTHAATDQTRPGATRWVLHYSQQPTGTGSNGAGYAPLLQP